MRYFRLVNSWPRALIASLAVLVALLLIAYASFCNQIGRLADVEDAKTVVVSGIVREAWKAEELNPEADKKARDIYMVEDPTGCVYVLTQLGLPRPGTVTVVWGKKRTTDPGRPQVEERNRAGSF